MFLLVQSFQVSLELVIDALTNKFFQGELTEEDTIDQSDSIGTIDLDLPNGVNAASIEKHN